MPSVFQGESRLFGFLGANVTLGGVRVAVEKVHLGLESVMPYLHHLLVLAQIAVAVATLVYMIVKIKKLRSLKTDDE